MSIAEKLTTIAENEQRVYEAGRGKGFYDGYHNGLENGLEQGYNDGYTKGETDGRQAEYDEFWDAFQWNGTKTTYAYSFMRWKEKCFYPKYDIVPNGEAVSLFQYAFSGENFDLQKRLDECGVTLSFENATSAVAMCTWSGITRFGKVDVSKITNRGAMFSYSQQLHTIEELVVGESDTNVFNGTFDGCSALKNITITGTIGRSISFSSSPLTTESAISVINALTDYSGTDKEFTYKVTFSATTKANLDALGNAAPNGETWLEYVQNVLCWNV